jgi:hypothetical protein
MQYATEKIAQARNNIAETEQRILRQRRRVEKMLVERHPADEAQAQLLIMEQSLMSMVRFLANLERDIEMGDHGQSAHKHIKGDAPAPRTSEARPQSPQPPKNHS